VRVKDEPATWSDQPKLKLPENVVRIGFLRILGIAAICCAVSALDAGLVAGIKPSGIVFFIPDAAILIPASLGSYLTAHSE
jgi:hypothetical protein